MNLMPILIAGLGAAAILVVSVGIAMSGSGGGVADRLERYASSRGRSEEDGDERESAVVAGLNRVIESQDLTTRMSTDLARADLKLKPAEFLLLWIATPFVVVAAFMLFGLVFDALRSPLALVGGVFLGIWLPRYYLHRRQRGRLKSFNTQLPDTITLLANSLRAGSSFLQGMELVSREARPPIADEFARVVREMSLGMGLQPALSNLVRRVASEDLELMVTAINIQAQVGGNLATVLDAIAFTIRERVRIQGEIQTLTAMQRYSGYVIVLLPVGLAVLLFVISPTYMVPMTERPPELFGLPLGIVLFLLGGLSMGIGWLFIRRIVDIKV
ncbi:MAG: secretion system protein [Chloroflexi bacterium]|nr:MAG: secretion system protein [Chloroflexota bacterium]